jgi:hypothetical protein
LIRLDLHEKFNWKVMKIFPTQLFGNSSHELGQRSLNAKKWYSRQALVPHAYNPSFSGDKNQEDHS